MIGQWQLGKSPNISECGFSSYDHEVLPSGMLVFDACMRGPIPLHIEARDSPSLNLPIGEAIFLTAESQNAKKK